MKLAIMQPYIFPYIGYFQLINAADKFVILDDVNYINKGWINRNRIIANKKEFLFTIPLKKASQNKMIKEIEIIDDNKWRDKLLKTISINYRKSLCYSVVYPVIEEIIQYKETKISTCIFESLNVICKYLDIKTEIIPSSYIYNNSHLKAQEKILDICKKEAAKVYINPIGGSNLYKRNVFEKEGIELRFLKSRYISYKQNTSEFIPWLSIIDIMMFNSKETICKYLEEYELLSGGRNGESL